MNVLNGAQREDANEQAQYRADERPCPACRGAVSKDKLFLRAAFEPTEAELTGNGDVVASKGDGDVEMVDVEVKPKPGRALRKRKPTKRIVDSDEEDEAADNDDDLSDFIAEDDEDEDEADARRAAWRRLRKKGKARKVVVSDDEMDDDIICGTKPDFIPVNPEQIKIMPRFLPSTKMKVIIHYSFLTCSSLMICGIVYDGNSEEVGRRTSGREGMMNFRSFMLVDVNVVLFAGPHHISVDFMLAVGIRLPDREWLPPRQVRTSALL